MPTRASSTSDVDNRRARRRASATRPANMSTYIASQATSATDG